jgi:hypothetical protein
MTCVYQLRTTEWVIATDSSLMVALSPAGLQKVIYLVAFLDGRRPKTILPHGRPNEDYLCHLSEATIHESETLYRTAGAVSDSN